MSRNSYKEICPIYRQLYKQFPGITKIHLIQIFEILHNRDPKIPKLRRVDKRSKFLIICRFKAYEKTIQQYISLIVPVDKSGRKISNIKEINEISWAFLDELEHPNIQAELGAANNLNQNDDLGQIDNPSIHFELGFVNSLNQNDDLSQIDNQNIQFEPGSVNNLNQNDNLGQIDNQNNQFELGVTSIEDQEEENQIGDIFFKFDDSNYDMDFDPYSNSLLGMHLE